MSLPHAGQAARDYSKTLFLPKTPFPMRASAASEEALLERWSQTGLEARLSAANAGAEPFVLHDGPPYANGSLHMGHALNKVLKDAVVRFRRMEGRDVSWAPGWDCHGLPVEWKVEQEFRRNGRAKAEVSRAEFRAACRAHADRWLTVQEGEFRRLGASADFADRWTTMDFPAEAAVAVELMRLAASGQVYRSAKPVLWSVAEGTALAEAEVEHHDHVSDFAHVAFPVASGPADLVGASVAAWTTTPWTLPGNRALAYGSRMSYGLWEGADGRRLLLSDALAEAVLSAVGLAPGVRVRTVTAVELAATSCRHPLAAAMPGYGFEVPLLDGVHVTDDAGTGFVHTAPGHGREDWELWTSCARDLSARGLDAAVPSTVAGDGTMTAEAPGFEGRRVFNADGSKGDANAAVLDALDLAGTLLGKGRMTHPFPHSWRSRTPLMQRATPQWFLALDRDLDGPGDTLRARALAAVEAVEFTPASGRNRLRSMVAARPDWVLSRQRAWGVPLTLFRNPATGEVVPGPGFPGNAELSARVEAAFTAEGADAWFEEGARGRFLSGLVENTVDWEMVEDVLDVWFDSGCTHAFANGGRVSDLVLEGSDQHRGWFQSSLLEACATRGRAPYGTVATHGFVLDERARKMSKGLGNVTSPVELAKSGGVDLLRLWALSSDWKEDVRLGEDLLKSSTEALRKLRNTLRWMLGNLSHHDGSEVAVADMPELERLTLHRLSVLDPSVRAAFARLDFREAWTALQRFLAVDLSALHFDVRKDLLYCGAPSSPERKRALHALSLVLERVLLLLAPMLPFTAEEAWLAFRPSEDGSVHLERLGEVPADWRDDALARRWDGALALRSAVLAALEPERAAGRLGSALEASVTLAVGDPALLAAVEGVDLAELCLVASVEMRPSDAGGVAVEVSRAEGRRCERSWRVTLDVGTDPDHPGLAARDAAAVREWDALVA